MRGAPTGEVFPVRPVGPMGVIGAGRIGVATGVIDEFGDCREVGLGCRNGERLSSDNNLLSVVRVNTVPARRCRQT